MPTMDEEISEVKLRSKRVSGNSTMRENRRRSGSESSDGERGGKRGERRGRYDNERKNGRESGSESSDGERDRRREDRRERDVDRRRKREDREDGENRRKRVEDKVDNKGKNVRESGSESSDGERDRRREDRRGRDLDGVRKRREREDGDHRRKSLEKEDTKGKNGRESDSESSDGEMNKKREDRRERDLERGRKRGEREDGDHRSKRLEDKADRKELEGMNRRGKDNKRKNEQESGSESSDVEKDRKREDRRERDLDRGRKREEREDGGNHSKRLEDKEDRKEVVDDGRDRRRKVDRRRNERDRESDSSEGEDRRRQRRDRERRRRRDDEDDLDGRRKRDHRGDRKERIRKELPDLDGKGKVEEYVKPPERKVVDTDENPGGPIATLGKTGGVYIPRFKLARMMKEIEDKSSVEYQRLTWDALRKSINGLVNKVNATNIKNIIPELFSENLIRGRGLFCRSCMKSQMASPGFTDVFAALVAVVNTKFPELGELLLRRIVLQLKRAYKRNDKPQLIAAVKFIAHLVNQQVAHELVALELLTILLEQPTDDSVEVAVDFVKECGCILQDLCPKGLHGIFERFRGILHEGEIDKRVQFLIEGLFAIRKAKFQGHPAVRPELDLVEPEDQLTHEISLDDEVDAETSIDIFRQDPNFIENERKYEELKKSILGDESEDEEDDDGGSDEDEEEDEDEELTAEQMQIKDATETNLINLRRTIYLTIMSSVDFEEAGHKLLKIKLEPGQEMELCIMLLECCSQERTYLRYYGLLGQRFCMIHKVHQENFEKCFVQQYSMIHRLETNKLRNVAKFFAHLLGTDALPWHVLSYIRLTEEDTTSSSRIFIKILFQELSEHLGIRLLNERLNDPSMNDSFESIFPKDNPRNTRFAINFFTSIGLGGLTENLREYLKNMPRMIMQQQKPESEDESDGSGPSSSSSSSGSESSSSDSSSSDDSDSEEDRRRKRRKRK